MSEILTREGVETLLDALHISMLYTGKKHVANREEARAKILAHDAALRAEVERLRHQLPQDMENCTIRFNECEKGHGWLTATNWVPIACPTCRAEKAEREINDAWLMIENGWADNIESRAEWERRYRDNFDKGGSGPLGMAIHAAGYKRETTAEARAEKLAAALRDAPHGQDCGYEDEWRFENGKTIYTGTCNCWKAGAARALAEIEKEEK